MMTDHPHAKLPEEPSAQPPSEAVQLREAVRRAHGLHLSNGTVTLDFHEDEDAAALWNLLEGLNR